MRIHIRQLIQDSAAIIKKTAIGIAFATPLSVSAIAADMAPVYKAAPVAEYGRWYVWADGFGERVNLPDVALGLSGTGPTPLFAPTGVLHTLTQRLNGAGVRGGLGYNLPGTNYRMEFGGSLNYAKGADRGNGVFNAVPNVAGIGVQFLDGSVAAGALLCTLPTCITTATLTSEMTAWQLNGKIAYDAKFGAVTWSPWVGLIGGHTTTTQSLTETLIQQLDPLTVINLANFQSNTSVKWTDLGARVGLNVNADVNSWLILGAGGHVGIVRRAASLNGNDQLVSTNPLFTGASVLSVGRNTSAFVANGEISAAVKLTRSVALRGFAGVNYDGRVPGISSPSYTFSNILPQNRTAADIAFHSESSFYAGAGMIIQLGGEPLPIYAKN